MVSKALVDSWNFKLSQVGTLQVKPGIDYSQINSRTKGVLYCANCGEEDLLSNVYYNNAHCQKKKCPRCSPGSFKRAADGFTEEWQNKLRSRNLEFALDYSKWHAKKKMKFKCLVCLNTFTAAGEAVYYGGTSCPCQRKFHCKPEEQAIAYYFPVYKESKLIAFKFGICGLKGRSPLKAVKSSYTSERLPNHVYGFDTGEFEYKIFDTYKQAQDFELKLKRTHKNFRISDHMFAHRTGTYECSQSAPW